MFTPLTPLVQNTWHKHIHWYRNKREIHSGVKRLTQGLTIALSILLNFPIKWWPVLHALLFRLTVGAGARANACVRGVPGATQTVLSRGFSFQRLVFISLVICMINIYPQIFASLKELSKVQHCGLRRRWTFNPNRVMGYLSDGVGFMKLVTAFH